MCSRRMRIFQYYLPVFFWCWRQVQEHQQAGAGRPLVIGMQAVQGCGKTTLVSELQLLFAKVGLTAASVSIDDFYLTFNDQQALIKVGSHAKSASPQSPHQFSTTPVCTGLLQANGMHAHVHEHSTGSKFMDCCLNKTLLTMQANPDNFLLGVRGNALTHDLDLGRTTLQSLQQLARGSSGAVTLPRYDKSAHQGRGDRADASVWPTVRAPVDVVLFEGWMLGFSPVSQATAEKVRLSVIMEACESMILA